MLMKYFVFLSLFFAASVLGYETPRVSSTLTPCPTFDSKCQRIERILGSERIGAAEVKLETHHSVYGGDYHLISDYTMTRTKMSTPKPIDPSVIEPPVVAPGGLPFGDISALQALGLLPEYIPRGGVTVDTNIAWTGHGGERGEIGYLPEDHASVIAGQRELIPGILEVADQSPPSNMDFAHHPNLFWLPFLLTGDVKYVRHLERVHQLFMGWRRRELGEQFHGATAGRELAWNLRDLFQLVWLQDRGYTEGDTYRSTYEKTRDTHLAIIADPSPQIETFRVVRWNATDHASYGFTGWMEYFVGIVENRGVQMGFEDWRPIAEFHWQHLIRRIENWKWKGFDANHVFPWQQRPEAITAFNKALPSPKLRPDYSTIGYTAQMHWSTDPSDELGLLPYHPVLVALSEFQNWPHDQLFRATRVVEVGGWYTFPNRAHDAYSWGALAAMNGIDGAEDIAKQLHQKITERGDTWAQRHSIKGPQ